MIDRQKIKELRNDGKTYEEIGLEFSVTRQRIHQIYTGYMKKYQQSEKWKAYKRHYKGHTHPYRVCSYCETEKANLVNMLDKSI
jgi:hypothetical protein